MLTSIFRTSVSIDSSITSLFIILFTFFVHKSEMCKCYVNDCSYVPMFGETEYDPNQPFCSVSIDEQLEALSRAVNSGKVSDSGALLH